MSVLTIGASLALAVATGCRRPAVVAASGRGLRWSRVTGIALMDRASDNVIASTWDNNAPSDVSS
jgi:hypothetical protein